MKKIYSLACLTLAFLSLFTARAELPLPERTADMLGGGNFVNGKLNDAAKKQIAILKELGMNRCRINLYPRAYLADEGKWDQPKAGGMDELMSALHAAGIEPVLLFEYYSNYYDKQGLGTAEQWAGVGFAFAERYGPGGTWAVENGIGDTDYGVKLYTAFNEPEIYEFRLGGKLGPDPYVEALRGFAEGVKRANPDLKVAPGGFMAANAWNDWTLRGLGPALAPLFNEGLLDGIDIHTYYDVRWAPMEGGYSNSAMHNFLMVKRASGIKADVEFYATEWNYKFRETTREQAAKGVLTGLWDHVGVVGNDGKTPRTRIAFPWNLFHDFSKDTQFGMAGSLDPYEPSPRGKVLEMVLDLTEGMKLVASDPLGSGMLALTGNGKTMWVWQNREGWTDRLGTSLTLHGVPAAATTLVVYRWNGEASRMPVSGGGVVSVSNLEPGETYMFLADAEADGEARGLLPPDAYQIRESLKEQEREARDLTGSTLEQETFDGAELKGWKLAPSDNQARDATGVESVEATGAEGRCALLRYVIEKDDGGNVVPASWRFESGGFAGKTRPPEDRPARVVFNARGTKPGRQLRIYLHDRDGETFVSEGRAINPAWRTLVYELNGEGLKHWGGSPGNGVLDWPLKLFAVEVVNWGGTSPDDAEQVWIDDLRLQVPLE